MWTFSVAKQSENDSVGKGDSDYEGEGTDESQGEVPVGWASFNVGSGQRAPLSNSALVGLLRG